jgi:hypothetical protein
MRVRTVVLPVVVLGALIAGGGPAAACGRAGMTGGGGEVSAPGVSPARIVPGGAAWAANGPSNAADPADVVRDDTATVAVSGEPFPVQFAVAGRGLRSGVLYVADSSARFVPLPLRAGQSVWWGGAALVGQVPASMVHGRQLRYYAVFRDRETGQPITVPAAGAAHPRPVWVVRTPVEVRLGRHRFGALTAPDAVVARVDVNGVGWEAPREGAAYGPSSFEIASNGAVWLLDEVNKRLLGWRPDTPSHPATVVPLPVFAADFALGPNGTFYLTAAGTPAEKTMVLYSITAHGRVRWRALLATDVFNAKLRMGPDRVLYDVTDTGWMPVATAAGTPLSVAAQRRLTQAHQPTAGGGRLVVTYASPRDARIAVLDVTGRPIRAWRVTGDTDMAPPGAALPALVNGDPVVPFDLFQDKPTWNLEQLAVRLSASGASVRVRLDNTIWGDKPTTEYRTGPDGAFYQLQTSRTAGVKIVRYGLDTRPPRPTGSGHAGLPTPTVAAHPAATVDPAATGTAVPATPQAKPDALPPSTRQVSSSVLIWAGGIGLAVVATVGTALLMRRRRHQPWRPPHTGQR